VRSTGMLRYVTESFPELWAAKLRFGRSGKAAFRKRPASIGANSIYHSNSQQKLHLPPPEQLPPIALRPHWVAPIWILSPPSYLTQTETLSPCHSGINAIPLRLAGVLVP